MMKRGLLVAWFWFFGISVFAQEDPVLMRVNGKDILRSEFEYSYRHRTGNADAKLSPKEYAELFAQSKLKVEAAKVAGLDTTTMFRKLQEAWRSQLLKSYLTDKQVLDSCIRVLYQDRGLKGLGSRVRIMQIFKYLPQTITAKHLEEEKNRIDSIWQSLRTQSDLDFARLVEMYSEDKRSMWLERLQTTSEFENVAFSLSTGEISHPFFTPEGLHIIKVIDRKENPSYGEVYEKLAERLIRKEGVDKATETIVERLKRDWQYAPNPSGMNELLTIGRTEQTLFTIDGQVYSGEMFKQFASSHPQAVKRQLNGFIAKSLLDYEGKNIERKHPEVRYALQKVTDKYLIAEVTRQKVDLPAINDRAGLATYFKFHTSDYRWDSPRYKGAILHCVDKKTSKQAKKLLKKTPEKEWAEVLRQTFNTSGEEKIKVEQGIFADGDNKYIDKLVFKKGDFEPLMSYPFTVVVGKKQKGPDDYREVIEQVRKDGALMVPVIVLGGIYGGIMTPTEAAAIAAFYGLIVGLFLYKEMDFKCLINSCIESCETSAVIIVLMAMATLFGNIMTIEDVPGTVARAILSFSENKIVILMLINVLLLIVGTFMEALAAIVILVPILLPIVTGVGVSPLHFGVIIVVNLAIGFITPPVGVNLFVASGVAKAKLENIASQALPMIALMLIVLLICTYIPEVPLILVGGPH